jgi:hypothetical protein
MTKEQVGYGTKKKLDKMRKGREGLIDNAEFLDQQN